MQVVPKTPLDGVPLELMFVGDDAPTMEMEFAADTTTQTPIGEFSEEKEVIVKQVGQVTMFSFDSLKAKATFLMWCNVRRSKFVRRSRLVRRSALAGLERQFLGRIDLHGW